METHRGKMNDGVKCKKCGGEYPCPKHTVIIDQKTGTIQFPDGLSENQKQRMRDLRDVFYKEEQKMPKGNECPHCHKQSLHKVGTKTVIVYECECGFKGQG